MFIAPIRSMDWSVSKPENRPDLKWQGWILERGLHQLHHHIDDMAWSTELAVLTGSGNFTQQILINITHDVLIVHIHGIDSIHDLGQHLCCGDQEYSVFM